MFRSEKFTYYLRRLFCLLLILGTLPLMISAQECEEDDDDEDDMDQCVGPDCGDDDGDDIDIPIIRSSDPNEIIGPLGFGIEKWVSVNDIMPYRINYENDPDFATAPAQKVIVRLPIDENLNLLSFRLGDFGFGDFFFTIPDNSLSYSNRLDVVDSLGIFVDVVAGVDITQREAFWIFSSIDPNTGLPPDDATQGYLPVNDSTRAGEGFVLFTIRPVNAAVTGDSALAQATIIFDINAPLPTNIEKHLIDAFPPTSLIDSLPPLVDTTTVQLKWTSDDDPGGVGVGEYELYVSENGSPFFLFQDGIDTTVYDFTGVRGNLYDFYTIAIDNVGNREGTKSAGDVSTLIKRNFVALDLKVYLEGAWCMGTCASGAPAGTMDTVLNAANLIPLDHPYDSLLTGAGTLLGYDGDEAVPMMPDPEIVDWLLLSLRSGREAATAFDTMAVFLRNDGTLLTTSGLADIEIELPDGVDSFSVVIEHYNHLIVMSNDFLTPDIMGQASYDFTTGADMAYTVGQSAGLKDLSGAGTGPWAMFSGNGYYDVNINPEDHTLWLNDYLLFSQYLPTNYRFDLNIDQEDKNLWFENNLLYSAVPR